MYRNISNTILKDIIFIILTLEIELVSTKTCHNSLEVDYSPCSWMSKCVLYSSEDKEYKVGTQTSHCKRKGWILPFFCFSGVFIAIIIGYVLFHYRKEQMEPILRPATFYQPRNSFFKSRFYNKHSPFKYLSYNPSMRYSGNMNSFSGIKSMDGRKNYHNLEIPVNYINGNNINNNINNVINDNNYQDLDPTIYPEYDNTVEIINGNRTNFNSVSQMNPVNSMSMNMNNMNNMSMNNMNNMSRNNMNNISYMNNMNNMSMSNVNNMNNLSRNHSMIQNQYNNRISSYNEVPSHILSELDSTTTTITTTTTTSMTETDTERPSALDNEYSIVSSNDDYYTESENYTNSYYNKNNIPPPQNRMINSYNSYIQQNNNPNNQVDSNQSYIFSNPPVELENSYIIGPNNDENIDNNNNNNNNFNDPRYNNSNGNINSNNNISNYQPYTSSYSNLPNFRNSIMKQNQNPHHHMRNYSYSMKNTFNDASREELMRRSQSSKIHRRSYSYNDDINQYKRNQSYNSNNNINNNDYNYNDSFYNQNSDYSEGVTSKTLRSFIEKSNSNRQLNQSHSNILNNNPYSYTPSRPQSQNTILTPASNNNSVLGRSPIPLSQKAYPSHPPNYIPPSNDIDSSFSITNNSTTTTTITETSTTTTTTTDDDLTTESTTTEYSIYRRKGNRDNSSSHYIAAPMNNFNNGNAPNIMQKGYDNSYFSQSNLQTHSHSHSHIQSYPEFQQRQQQQSVYYNDNNNYNRSLNNINPSYSRRSGIRLNQSPSVSRISSKNSFYKPSTLINPQGSIANYENSTNRSRTFYPSTVY